MNYIPIEIWQKILFRSTFLQQIRLRQICKRFYEQLEIHDFGNIDKYSSLLTDQILTNYSFVKYLDISNNKNITNLKDGLVVQ